MRLETDVLIVGGGPAGLAAALILSTYGIKTTVVTKRQGLARTPRAHVTNQRTFEIFRDLGIEAEARKCATSYFQAPDVVYCATLAGEEFARWRAFGTGAQRIGDYRGASPCEHADLAQNLLEPLLLSHSLARGANVRLGTEYVSHVQDDHEVRATAIDLSTGAKFELAARFLIGADGANSQVVRHLALPMEGQGKIGHSLNIYFEADLTDLVAYRPAFLYCLISKPKSPEDLGLSVLRPTRHWHEWLLTSAYIFASGRAEATEENAIGIVRERIGVPDLKVQVKAIDPWDINALQASRYSRGRVFCIGDAVHRHSPANGLGSNTAIQDAYNLAWKLAFVLKGKADPSLLATYDAERIPVGKKAVERSTASLAAHTSILKALGFDESDNQSGPCVTSPQDLEGRQARLHQAVSEAKNNFNAHGVEMNQVYVSTAVIPDGTPERDPERDRDLYCSASTRPGFRLPHAWLQMQGRKTSTLDIVGKGRFALLTGVSGAAWVQAAAFAARKYRIEIDSRMIGPGAELTDLYGEWAAIREIEGSGCLLVRPDGHIAMRQKNSGSVEKARQSLVQAMEAILGGGA